jgi:hypothetical protein
MPAQAADRHWLAACYRRARAGIEPLPNFDEPALADELAQCAADLVIAADPDQIIAAVRRGYQALDSLQ